MFLCPAQGARDGPHPTAGCMGGRTGFDGVTIAFFPTVKLPLAEGHRTAGEQRYLGSVVGSRGADKVGKSESCGHLALKQISLDAKPNSPGADIPPFPHMKQMKLSYYIPNLSGCSLV